MMSYLFSDSNWIFTIALGIAVSLLLVEGIGIVLGVKILSLIPSRQDSIQAGHNHEKSQNLPVVSGSLLFLCLFGLSGYLVNFLLIATLTSPSSPWLTIFLTLVFALTLSFRINKAIVNRPTKLH